MSLWIVVGNRHPKYKAGTYVRLYDDHFREQRVIPKPNHRFATEDLNNVEIPIPELEDKVFPVGQKANRTLFRAELGHAAFRNSKRVRPPSPIILPGDEGFTL